MIEMFKYLLGILDKKEQREWEIYAFLSFVSPVVDIFSFSVIIYIINVVIKNNEASPEMVAFTLVMGMISILKGGFELYKTKISNHFIFFSAQKLSVKVYELFAKENLLYHNQRSMMQALSLVREDTTACMNIIAECTKSWINILTMAGFSVILTYVSGWLGIVSCILLIVFMIIVFLQHQKQMKVYGEKRRMYAIRANAQVTTAYGSFKEMKIDNRSDFMTKKYQETSREYARVQGEYASKTSMVSVIMQNSIMTVMFMILAAFLQFGTDLSSALAPLVIYVTLLIRMIPLAYSITNSLNSIEFSKKSYEMIRESFAQYSVVKQEEVDLMNVREKNVTFERGIAIRHLSFGYSDKMRIFSDVSLDIPAGRSIAVIGPSGAGKTTFLDLILGLLTPQSGSILYDDYDIVSKTDAKGECKASLGKIVSYIPQTVYLNGETIRNNVAFFEDDEQVDEARVIECLKCAQIWEDVTQWEEGIHTVIGENGTTISGGQRQRIALARALYKDFELLIMDEATAALDMETEKAVIESIRQVRDNKTLLMVTHHMSLANECDIVYKIENKNIIRVR